MNVPEPSAASALLGERSGARPRPQPASRTPVRDSRRLARRRRRILLLVWAPLLLGLSAAWALTLRPQNLGGPAGYVMVRGVSMQPTLEAGDLVIARPAAVYRKGDIIVYRIPEGDVGAGMIVVHRIIAGSPRRGFVVKGDNNPAPDAWRPKPDDIVGRTWLHLPHLAQLLAFLRAPIPLASLGAGIAVAIIAVPSKRAPARRTRGARATSGNQPAAKQG